MCFVLFWVGYGCWGVVVELYYGEWLGVVGDVVCVVVVGFVF